MSLYNILFSKISIAGIMLFIAVQPTFATCSIFNSAGKSTAKMSDGINVILSSGDHCPKDVFEFRQQMKAAGLSMETTMVANRGFHNPAEGSFSFFEIVTGKLNAMTIKPGDFFFGHFTTVNENNELTADQSPATKLIIEAFAWDVNKNVFNFYELRGNGKSTQWFYRGDTADIYADNTFLHRQPDPSHPQFGDRLRCSACHSAGGPIMKEIHAPYNDWWQANRKLDFGGRKPDASIRDLVENLVPASRLAESVVLGLQRLDGSDASQNKNSMSLQEKLRPVFCPGEINFASDMNPNEDKNSIVNIPVDFFINKKLVNNPDITISIARKDYEAALKITHSRFPETTLSDADHAWLTPIKATSDQLAIERLIKAGLIDEKFTSDVLSVDATNPVFSSARCGLLKFVPKTWTSNWQDEFITQLKSAKNPAAKELLSHLTNPSHTPDYHQQKAKLFLMNCRDKLKNSANVTKMFLLLLQRRTEIAASEISKNKLGKILEPGFRVIFPETDIHPEPGKLELTDLCEVK